MKNQEKKLNRVQKKATKLLDELYNLIEQIPQKGNTAEDCQKICISNAIYDLEHTFNGLSVEDFEKV